MRKIFDELGPPFMFLFAAICMLPFAAANVQAQNVQTAECSKGCDFAADPSPETTTCLLSGVPGASSPIAKPVIPRSQVPAAKQTGLKDPTCWWPAMVIAPGSYTMTAIGQAADGRRSEPSVPLSLTVSPPPLGAPSGLRFVP